MAQRLICLLLGVVFGFALSRSGPSDYDLIRALFSGKDFTIALVIGTAVVTAAIGMKLLALMGNRGFRGEMISIKKVPLSRFTLVGGILFGIGWALSGACPGTLLAQIGEGKILGLFTALGLVAGTYAYALIAEKHPMS